MFLTGVVILFTDSWDEDIRIPAVMISSERMIMIRVGEVGYHGLDRSARMNSSDGSLLIRRSPEIMISGSLGSEPQGRDIRVLRIGACRAGVHCFG